MKVCFDWQKELQPEVRNHRFRLESSVTNQCFRSISRLQMPSDSQPFRYDDETRASEPSDREAVRQGKTHWTVRAGGDSSPENTTDADQLLVDTLERYAQVAPLNDRSELQKFLPSPFDLSAHRFVLFELIKLDMAMAAEQSADKNAAANNSSVNNAVPRIESYVDSLPDYMTSDSIPLDLVMEEIQLRREAGDTPDHAEYKERFPQFDAVLSQILGAHCEATSAVKNRGVPPELEIGSQIDDFLIIQTLGSGAFAHVYLARQLSMHRLVALKVSRGTGDEPQALSQFDHPNIVRVFDQRELDSPAVHLLYMQFHPGGTLSDVVKVAQSYKFADRNGTLLLDVVDRQLLKSAQVVPERSSVRRFLRDSQWPTVVAWLGIQLARALDEAHSLGVLHRDVKPANVLLSGEGIPKLADFNVSFAGAAGRAGAASSFGGSVGYMSPEHLRAISATIMEAPEEVGAQADLYSLGILLWELWQGKRPFNIAENSASWTQAIADQLSAREQPLETPQRLGTASERVLESTLRTALQFDAKDRPTSGAELAGRLKLALHPEAAGIFDPDPTSWRHRVLQWKHWIVPSAVLLVPNIFAMAFNYVYNFFALLGKHESDIPQLKSFFNPLALVVSTVCLGVGIWFVVRLTKSFVNAIHKAKSNDTIDEQSIGSITRLGQNAALIGGSLWLVAGLVYPFALSWRFEELPTSECVRFFFSLVICGGVAAIYPYFGMTTLATLVYYPLLIKNSMEDRNFDHRAARVVQQSERFWLAAIAIPLLGIALLVFSDSAEKVVVFSAVAATGCGAILAMFAYRTIHLHWRQKMSRVLSQSDASVTPGLGQDD